MLTPKQAGQISELGGLNVALPPARSNGRARSNVNNIEATMMSTHGSRLVPTLSKLTTADVLWKKTTSGLCRWSVPTPSPTMTKDGSQVNV